MKQILAFAALVIMITSCNSNYEKTKSGLIYKIFKGKGGAGIKAGNFAKLNIEYKLSGNGKDSILNSTYGKTPHFTPIDTSANSAYSFMELLPKMKEGDSAIFTISIDTLKRRGAIPEYNEIFKRGMVIKGRIAVMKVYTEEAAVRADYEKEMTAQKDREVSDIKAYLAKNNIKAQQTTNGCFVEIQNAGDPNLKAQAGKQASIMYKGYLQSNLKVFDTNMDSSKGHTDPIDVVVGRGSVIPGWEEALPYFGKGGKGKIYIPSMLAYRDQGQPGAIPPFANLIFDIEIRDIKDAPKETAQQPGASGLTPEQMQMLQQQMQQQQQQGQGQQPPQQPH
jgi:FKBP-type peptidyl-prolyl cis-trans isomerase